jgi:hypothetical protein
MAGRISADEKKWRAQSDLETLSRASEIQADKARMAAVRSHAQAQVKALTQVTGKPKAPTKAPAKKGR